MWNSADVTDKQFLLAYLIFITPAPKCQGWLLPAFWCWRSLAETGECLHLKTMVFMPWSSPCSLLQKVSTCSQQQSMLRTWLVRDCFPCSARKFTNRLRLLHTSFRDNQELGLQLQIATLEIFQQAR